MSEVPIPKAEKCNTALDSLDVILRQRDNLATALESLCRAIISGEPRDITELLKKSGEALLAVRGGNHE